MGANCCTHDNKDSKCNCFATSYRHLSCVPVVRYSSTKWTWFKSHDDAVMTALSTFCSDYDAPHGVMQLIKQHAYSDQHHHYMAHVAQTEEKEYSQIDSKLLNKKLCPHWYSSVLRAKNDSICIGLHLSKSREDGDLFANLADNSLPALQMNPRSELARFEQERVTVHVDECQFSLHLIALRKVDRNHEKLMAFPNLHVIVLDEGDSVNWINVSCEKIWNRTHSMKNVLIFHRKISRHADKQAISEIARVWNVPCIQGDGDEAKSMKNLVAFMVKYYWFCNVIG